MNNRYSFHGAFNFSVYQKKFCNLTKLNVSYIASKLESPGKLLFEVFWQVQKQPPEMFCKKRCSEKLRKIHRKTDLRPATLLKQKLWLTWFPVNFAKFLRTTFLQNTSERLLLQLAGISPVRSIFLVKS